MISDINYLIQGMNLIVDAIRASMGPGGRKLCLDRGYIAPLITNDGKNIFRDFKLSDSRENVGAQLARELALKIDDELGNGSSRALVLMQSIVSEGMKYMSQGENVILINKGIEWARQFVLEQLGDYIKVSYDDSIIHQILELYIKDRDVRELLFDAIKQMKYSTDIIVERSCTMRNYLDCYSGFCIEKSIATQMMTDNYYSGKCVYEDVDILIYNKHFKQAEEIYPILEYVIQRKKPLLIVVDGIEEEALGIVNVNNRKGVFSVAAIEAPAYGENRINELFDIAAFVGAVPIVNKNNNINKDMISQFVGHADKVIFEKNKTIIIDGNSNPDQIFARIKEIEKYKDNAESEFVEEVYNARLRRLSGNNIILNIGAYTDIDFIEKKWCISNAVRAIINLQEEGYVIGGEMVFLHLSEALKEQFKECDTVEKIGINIMSYALKQPFCQLVNNAGYDADYIAEVVLNLNKDGTGFNILSGCIEDLYCSGIIEPAKNIRVILENAVSMAKLILTVDKIVYQ